MDCVGLGLVSLDCLERHIKRNLDFAVMHDVEVLKLAYSVVKGETKGGTTVTATRRSWVPFKDFLRVICHLFYFKVSDHSPARFNAMQLLTLTMTSVIPDDVPPVLFQALLVHLRTDFHAG
jgi:hypothetical protein